jgi:hypothetical protein
VKSYVDAQKSLMDVMVKAPNGAPKTVTSRKPPKRAKAAVAVA